MGSAAVYLLDQLNTLNSLLDTFAETFCDTLCTAEVLTNLGRMLKFSSCLISYNQSAFDTNYFLMYIVIWLDISCTWSWYLVDIHLLSKTGDCPGHTEHLSNTNIESNKSNVCMNRQFAKCISWHFRRVSIDHTLLLNLMNNLLRASIPPWESTCPQKCLAEAETSE